MAISGSTLMQFGILDSQTVGTETITRNPSLRSQVNWSDGEGANAVEDISTKVHTLTGGSDTIDLTSGFVDLNGAAIAFTTIKAILLIAPAANAASVVISTSSTNEWDSAIDGTITLKPGSAIMLHTANAAGYTVTNGTKDLLGITGTLGDVLQVALAGTV